MGRDPTPTVLTFLHSATATPVNVTEAQRKSALNVEELFALFADIHTRVKSTLAKHRERR